MQLLSLPKHRVYVKGHQNEPLTQRIMPRRDHVPVSEIPASTTGIFFLHSATGWGGGVGVRK